MADSSDCEFANDPRIPCKYGEKCYQKNPNHHKKFKHKPVTETKTMIRHKRKSDELVEPPSKKHHAQKTALAEDEHDGEPEIQIDENDDEVDLPASPQSIPENIKQKFLTDMPDDFYAFWEFCKSLDADHPEDALKETTGLQLVGPYDVLSGKIASLKNRKPSAYLTYYRYYYDPPEFQTVLKGCDVIQHHFGYFRDRPDEPPVFVADNEATNGCTIRPLGENIFAAVSSFIESKLSKAKQKDMQLEKLKEALQQWAKKSKFSLEKNSAKMKARNKKVVTKCFHGAGIVINDKKTEIGYRELPESDGQLRKIMQSVISSKTQEEKDKKFDRIQEIITLIQFANDEMDYGMGLELALDLFCFGDAYFNSTILCMLPLAYTLLKRPQFAQIAEAHIRKRSKSIR